MKVSEVMTRRVIAILPEASISDAVKLMLKNQISGLPVIDDKRKADRYSNRRRPSPSSRNWYRTRAVALA